MRKIDITNFTDHGLDTRSDQCAAHADHVAVKIPPKRRFTSCFFVGRQSAGSVKSSACELALSYPLDRV